jgi:predicted esterase
MKCNRLLFILFFCFSPFTYSSNNLVIEKSLSLYDKSRNRPIPVELYVQDKSDESRQLVVLINHGYTIKNTEYAFLAKALASKGYFIISIQHDLKTDPPLALSGNLIDRRKPLWERGVVNTLFVLKEIRRTHPKLNVHKIILIGHSNGGDIAMLFASIYPESVLKIVSLDSLRMPFPRNKNIPILSLRAIDTKADPNVLPPLQEQKKLHINLIRLKNAKHIDLCDRGPKLVQHEVNEYILKFLKGTQ